MKSEIRRLSELISVLEAAGYTQDGHTTEERVRVPTTKAPAFGGVGGVPATFGGRLRLRSRSGIERVTVGLRTVCFYSVVDGKAGNFRNFGTTDPDIIKLTQLEAHDRLHSICYECLGDKVTQDAEGEFQRCPRCHGMGEVRKED